MKRAPVQRRDVDWAELRAVVERSKQGPLSETDYKTLLGAIETLGQVVDLLEGDRATLRRLRELLFGSSANTEKTSKILGGEDATRQPTGCDASPTPGSPDDTASDDPSQKGKRRGHGRIGADAYMGADRIPVKHESLKPGDHCPECKKGRLYELKEPAEVIRITGRAPLHATIHQLQRLRCSPCGEVFTAAGPPELAGQKYDPTAAAMIALLKYGSGLPFNRLEGLQGNLQIPLPASTQWEIVEKAAGQVEPAFDELIRQAAQAEVVHNDDTSARILDLDKARVMDDDVSPNRTGVFTSGIVAEAQDRRIALFFTGRRHAGENLAKVLAHRSAELAAPIQMCDALSRNPPKDLEVIVAHCIAHSRRRFVKATHNFPAECAQVLLALRDVYRNDELARERGLSADERLCFHQEKSGPIMDRLKKWLDVQFPEKRVEPSSGLGQAISYMLKHWKELTLFLRQAGAPLDNNVCERALKKAILHRKNAMFFKTQNGAHVGDVFLSLIHTAELAGANAFDYLVQLIRHADQVAADPGAWLPWNYPAAVTASSSRPTTASPAG